MTTSIDINFDPSFTKLYDLCEQTKKQTIDACSKMYGFDATSAHASIMISKSGKISKRKNKAASTKKRATTGYILFSSHIRPTLKNNNSQDQKNIMTQIAAQWNSLEDNEKIIWKNKADDLKMKDLTEVDSVVSNN